MNSYLSLPVCTWQTNLVMNGFYKHALCAIQQCSVIFDDVLVY